MIARPTLFLDHTAQLGGAELSLARYLRHDGGASAVLGLLSPDPVGDWQLPANVPVFQTRATAGESSIRTIVSELSAIVARVNPSVIVANSYSAAQYLSFLPKRDRQFVYFLRQAALPDGLATAKVLLNKLFVLRRFDSFIANSEWTASTLPTRVRATRPVEISYPISGFVDSRAPRQTGPSRELRLLTLSRLSPWKGVHTAIEAVALANGTKPGVSLTVAGGDLFGEGGYTARLHRMSRGLDVTFTGHLADPAPLLDDADVLLCLSATPEPFGQVVVQGMASGCVVIATDHGGPREIIEDGVDGFLVEPGSPQAVRDVLARLQTEPGLLATISANAVRSARRYRDDSTIRGFSDALASLSQRARA